MLELARSLGFISTPSEIEALILESQLIKKFQPAFNITLRDDKQYFYVVFTKEKFPKIFISHQPHIFKYLNIEVSDSVGPFTDGGALKTALRVLRSIFPYCTCKQTHHNFCLNYHIDKCLGFCCLKKPSPETQGRTLDSYLKNIEAIKDILSGKKSSLIKKLEKEMRKSAQNGNLEKAIELRKKISNLKRIFENAKIIKSFKILEAHHSDLESLLKIQKPITRIEGYDVSNIQGAHAVGSMVTFVHGQPDKNFYRKFKIKKTNKKEEGDLFHDRSKNTTYGGDTGMLKEILERRFKHEEWPFPDLVLIDGGKAQLNVARSVISNYYTTLLKKQRAPLLIALAKNKKHVGEKIFISGRKNPLPLTKLSSSDRNLLLHIDSEAHRFAIGYYRRLHRKLFK